MTKLFAIGKIADTELATKDVEVRKFFAKIGLNNRPVKIYAMHLNDENMVLLIKQYLFFSISCMYQRTNFS